jgi:hypothetical protein
MGQAKVDEDGRFVAWPGSGYLFRLVGGVPKELRGIWRQQQDKEEAPPDKEIKDER